MSTKTAPFRDRELLDLLSQEPELLAIADALVAAQEEAAPARRRTRVWRRPRSRTFSIVTAAALVASVAAVLLVAPWASGPSVVERAQAAVGVGEVLHVVTEQPSPYGWYHPVKLPSGEPIPVVQRQEIWFDQSRNLKRTVTILNGTVWDELLETPQGQFSPRGRVYTCAWVAAHPVEATKALVSCHANDENGTTPRHIPEPAPQLELALAGFIDHYQSALASGQAREVGSGKVDGRPVVWLRIARPREEVALDASTYKPVLVRASNSVEIKVIDIGTQEYEPHLFDRPALSAEWPSIGSTEGQTAIDLEAARVLLGGEAVWVGQAWNGYTLHGVERQDLVTGFGRLSHRVPVHSVAVDFHYERPDGTTLDIKEAPQCKFALAAFCGPPRLVREGVLSYISLGTGLLQRGDLFVAISGVPSVADALAVANALQPIPPP